MDAACSQCSLLTLLTSSTFCSNSAKLFLTASRRRNPLVSGLASTWHTAHNTNVWVSLSHLLQQHLQSRLDDLQVPAVLACHVLQSCLQHHLLKVLKISSMNRYWVSNIKLFSMFVNNIELFELIFISRKVRTHSWYWTLFWWSSFIVVSSLILLKDLIIFGKASTFYHRIKLVAESLNWALRLLMKAWVFLSSGFKIKHFSLKQINLIVSISKM